MDSINEEKKHGLIRRGAEADLFTDLAVDIKLVLKHRIPKRYRLAFLDYSIRSQRTVREARLLHEAKVSGVVTPGVIFVDRKDFKIYMQHVFGESVRDALKKETRKERQRICVEIGRSIGRLHRKEIIHGDLTTSNFIVMPTGTVALVDFGLGYHSRTIEDQGVDLFLLIRMLESHHFRVAQEAIYCISKGYAEVVGADLAGMITRKIQEIKRRGRYVVERWTRER